MNLMTSEYNEVGQRTEIRNDINTQRHAEGCIKSYGIEYDRVRFLPSGITEWDLGEGCQAHYNPQTKTLLMHI